MCPSCLTTKLPGNCAGVRAVRARGDSIPSHLNPPARGAASLSNRTHVVPCSGQDGRPRYAESSPRSLASACTRVHIHTVLHMDTLIYTHSPTRAHGHTHPQSLTHKYTLTCTRHQNTPLQARTDVPTYTFTHIIKTCKHTHMLINPVTRMYNLTHIHLLIQSHTDPNTRTQTLQHTPHRLGCSGCTRLMGQPGVVT